MQYLKPYIFICQILQFYLEMEPEFQPDSLMGY